MFFLNKKNRQHWYQKFAKIIIYIYIFLFPITFVSSLFNSFILPKIGLTIVTLSILIVLVIIKFIKDKKISLGNKYYLVIFILYIIATITSILISKRHYLSFLISKEFLIASLFLFFLIYKILIKDKIHIIYILFTSGFVISWIQILNYLGIISKLTNNFVFFNKYFSVTGSQISLILFITIITTISIIWGFTQKDVPQKILLFIISATYSVVLIISLSIIVTNPNKNLNILDYPSGWQITMDQMKSINHAFLGVGSNNFINLYTQNRPTKLNYSDNWTYRYNSSSSEILTILNTQGLVGLILILLIIYIILKSGLNKYKEDSKYLPFLLGFIFIILYFIFLPDSGFIYFLIFIFAIILDDKNNNFVIKNKPINILILMILLIIINYILIIYTKFFIADYYFKKSITYSTQNRGGDTYETQAKAINLNPYNYKYRMAFSNTNMALANAIATKENLTDEEKEKISQLISRSIKESKLAVSLNPENADVWINLARIYKTLINFAKGADQWAISSYVQASKFDKTNPLIRLELGSLLISLDRNEDAIDQFKQAIYLKSDYANAYYNLSLAYENIQKYPESYAALQNVLNLINNSDPDYNNVYIKLQQLQELIPNTKKINKNINQKKKGELTNPDVFDRKNKDLDINQL